MFSWPPAGNHGAYALLVILGIITAAAVLYLHSIRVYHKKYPYGPITRSLLNRILPVILLSSLIGARFLAVLLSWEYYRLNPGEIPLFWRGGLVFHGALAAGTAAAFISCRRLRLDPCELLDLLSAPLCIGYALGRLGCLVNGCCAGIPSSLPWAMEFPLFDTLPRHPTQLYSAVIAGGFFFLILRIYRKSTRRCRSFSWFLLFMGSYRFVIEFLRDEPVIWAHLSAGQLGGLVMTIISIILFIRYGGHHETP